MEQYNKIVVASLMFTEAHQRYINAKQDMDYIISILLTGSVIGIIAPLLKEQGRRTSHQSSVDICELLTVDGEKNPIHEVNFRETYNSLKHARNDRKKVKAHDDLIIKTDLRLEAAYLLDDAKEDFCSIIFSADVRSKISDEFLTLLESTDCYAWQV